MLKEIEIGDLVRVVAHKASYGDQSDIVGLVVALVNPEHQNWEAPATCARVEWTNGVKTLTGLPVLELV